MTMMLIIPGLPASLESRTVYHPTHRFIHPCSTSEHRTKCPLNMGTGQMMRETKLPRQREGTNGREWCARYNINHIILHLNMQLILAHNVTEGHSLASSSPSVHSMVKHEPEEGSLLEDTFINIPVDWGVHVLCCVLLRSVCTFKDNTMDTPLDFAYLLTKILQSKGQGQRKGTERKWNPAHLQCLFIVPDFRLNGNNRSSQSELLFPVHV